MTSPLGPAAVESEIWKLSAALEEQTEAYATAARKAAVTEVEHKVSFAKSQLRHRNEKTVGERDARALVETEGELMDRQVAEAVASAALESCRSLRARLSAVQSVGASIRAAMELGRSAA